MGGLLRWPTEDPLTTPAGRVRMGVDAGQIPVVEIEGWAWSPAVADSYQAGERLEIGDHVKLRGPLWFKA